MIFGVHQTFRRNMLPECRPEAMMRAPGNPHLQEHGTRAVKHRIVGATDGVGGIAEAQYAFGQRQKGLRSPQVVGGFLFHAGIPSRTMLRWTA
jgi:hypothetical protein